MALMLAHCVVYTLVRHAEAFDRYRRGQVTYKYAAVQMLYAEEERWPVIASGYVLHREPGRSGPRFSN